MRLARAHIWQVPRLAAILWAATRATPGRPCARSHADDLALLWRETWRGRVRVARARVRQPVRGRIAGFLMRRETRLHALYVAPRWRGRGAGRALLSEAQARAGALDLWVLEENTRARAFYRRAGFAEAEQDRRGGGNDEGLPDIRMIWRDDVWREDVWRNGEARA
ncbi:GNAT family N-acetyltransferase [Roseovarius ramblicola]|uniref:GNAT family N-acetyltransferase n=1 Tax=Roseovarius ramblicola TaxID=2022336 RepID=A0ABV5I3E6_9RHOB